jgi:hypothetical protein
LTETKIMTAEEWASAVVPRPLTLPSGGTIMVRPKSALAMAVKGQGAFDLVSIALKKHIGEQELTEKEKTELSDKDRNFDMASFMVETVIDHVISPKIVKENPQPGEMLFSRISDFDLMTIFCDATGYASRVGGLTGSVEKFRREQRIPRQRTGSKNVRSSSKRTAR